MHVIMFNTHSSLEYCHLPRHSTVLSLIHPPYKFCFITKAEQFPFKWQLLPPLPSPPTPLVWPTQALASSTAEAGRTWYANIA